MDAEGLLAVCIQHEIDHLEGKLFVDYLSELKRQLIRRRLGKRASAAVHGKRISRVDARRVDARRVDARRVDASSLSLEHGFPPLRLGFAGTPEFAVPALDALRRSHAIRAVFTQPDRPAGRGQPLHQSPVKRRLQLKRGSRCSSRPVSNRRRLWRRCAA